MGEGNWFGGITDFFGGIGNGIGDFFGGIGDATGGLFGGGAPDIGGIDAMAGADSFLGNGNDDPSDFWGNAFGSSASAGAGDALSGGNPFGKGSMFGSLLGNGGLPSLLQAGMTIPAYMLEKDNMSMMQDMMDWQKQAYEEDVARQEQQWNYNVEQQAANQQYVADTEGNLQLRDNYYDTPTAEEALGKWGM